MLTVLFFTTVNTQRIS